MFIDRKLYNVHESIKDLICNPGLTAKALTKPKPTVQKNAHWKDLQTQSIAIVAIKYI